MHSKIPIFLGFITASCLGVALPTNQGVALRAAPDLSLELIEDEASSSRRALTDLVSENLGAISFKRIVPDLNAELVEDSASSS